MFIPACSLPEPSTTNACLWEFSKTHTIDVSAHLQYLFMEGSFGLTLGSTKSKRTGACSVFDVHWLILLKSGGIVVKLGFCKWSFSPYLPPVQPFRILTRRRIILPSLVSKVNIWMSCCSQLSGTGLNAQLFLESWIYSPTLAASNGSGKTSSHKRENLVHMKYGVPTCWHQQTGVKSLQNEQATSGARTTMTKGICVINRLFSRNAAVEIISLWPSDHLLNWEQRFKWQLVCFMTKSCLTVIFKSFSNRPISNYG